MRIATLKALMEGKIQEAIVTETPGGIEAQEAAGQQAFVRNATLPIEIMGGVESYSRP